MAAHAGVFFFDGRPAEGELGALAAGLGPASPDGPVRTHAETGLAIAQADFRVWADEQPRPRRSPRGHLIAWDGRLDNRDDVLLRLGPVMVGCAADAAVAAAAFERWGRDGLRALVGEWSLAIWDAADRTLHLARDYIGATPLYYRTTRDAIVWSTSLAEIAERCGSEPSDTFAAEFMTEQSSGDLTPYDGILAVPAATCLSFSADGERRVSRFWDPDPGSIHFADARQYEERLRALWAEAVGARLRASGTVWAELSGGFDSSSVVCMTDALIRRGAVDASAVRPLSYVTLQSPEGDERRFIAEVEARIGVPSEILGVEAHQNLVDPGLTRVTPYAVSGVGLAGAQLVASRGGRVILSGRAGDAVMGCEPDNSAAVFDDISAGRLLRALGNMRQWSRATRKPILEIAAQLATQRTERGLAHVLDTPVADRRASAAALLAPHLQALARQSVAVRSVSLSRVRRSQRATAARLLAYASGSQLPKRVLPPGVLYTYPFTHRPLVEFVLAIPGEQLSAPGEVRSLMRRAFEGLVPARILRRVSKGYYPPSTLRAVRQQVVAMFPLDRLEVVRRGWIDPGPLRAAIGRLNDGALDGDALLGVLRLERWLESRTRRAPAAIPQRKEVRTNAVLNA